MERDVLTIKQLQEYLSCSRSFVYTLMKEHKLRYAKIGKRIFFRKRDLEKFFESRLVK
jgi:excisionase family DNA binding protein